MHILITGASGLLGSLLLPALTARGHRVTQLVRRPAGAGQARWDPAAGQLDPNLLRAVDAVVHLAGAPLKAAHTAAQRRVIRDSRVASTRLLATTIAGLDADARPKVLVCASGSNYYGDHGPDPVTEAAAPRGGGFMARLARDWEAAADPARDAGVRVVHLRTGIVLAPQGDALRRLLPFARLGLLGRFGSGRQYWPWIAPDDIIGLYLLAVEDERVVGPLNGSAPHPVTNAELTRTLARVLGRPVFPIPIPKLAPGIVVGPRVAGDLLYASVRMLPARAQEAGYQFRFPELEPALRAVLGR